MMHCDQDRLMRQVMQTNFALYDIILYLDTHPDCAAGLAYYRQMLCAKNAAEKEYEAAVGPLRAQDVNCSESWTWTDAPWPWE